ncbi:glycosyltransferase, partial [Clostridium butyricum]
MNIVLYKGNFNYDVVNYFVDEISDSLRKRGHIVYVIDIISLVSKLKKDEICEQDILNFFINNEIELVLSFNGINLINIDIYEKMNIILGIILVDHPFYHAERINRWNSKNTFVAVLDEGSISTVEKYINDKCILTHLMHGGSYSKNKMMERKVYDVIFCGGIVKPTLRYIEEVYSKLPQDLKIINDELLNNNGYMDKCLDEVIRKLNINKEILKLDEYRFILAEIYILTDKYKRDYMRYNILKNMLENGIKVDYFGNCNCEEFSSYDNFINHGSVEYSEILEAMKKAKILVNTIGYFENGSHERIFSSMLNRTLVISNQNNYAYNLYKDKESIVYFNHDSKEELIDKIKYYLEHDDERSKIVYNAYKITCKFNTWDNRVD